jgi:hypothetical protein
MLTIILFVFCAFALIALPPLIASLFFDFVRKESDDSDSMDSQFSGYPARHRLRAGWQRSATQADRFRSRWRFNR